MIILKEIKIRDFLSHEDTTIEFKDGDKLLLDGVSGSGKSSVVEALVWALYGVGRVDNRSLIRKGAPNTLVRVDLQDKGGDFYTIERTVTSAGKQSVVIGRGPTFKEIKDIGAGGVRDADAYIVKEILGASYQLFINSVVFPQDNAESFVTAPSFRRKELLLEILKTEAIDEYLKITKEMLTDKGTALALLDGGVQNSEAQILEYKGRIEEHPAVKARVAELETLVEQAKIKATLANSDAKKAADLHAAVEEAEAKMSRLMVSVSRHETVGTVEECEEVIKAEDQVRGELRETISHNEHLSSIMSERPALRDYESEISSIDRRIKKLVDETLPCPSGDACPYTKMVGPELELLKKELAKKTEEYEQYQLGIHEWEKKVEVIGPRRDATSLESELAKIDKAHETLRDLKTLAEIAEIEKAIKDAPKKFAVMDLVNKADIALREVNRVETELAERRSRDMYLDTLAADVVVMEAEVADARTSMADLEEEIDLLLELKDALGADGITAVALDYLLPSLEDKINEILEMLSDFRVSLSTQKAGATGGTVEGLFITVKNAQGEEFDFNSYSGGERVRISVAISEALASLQRVGFRIMDETIVALDEDMVENFTSVLTKIQGRYSQTICISHLQPVKDLFDKRLLVTKLDGVSSVS